MRFKTVIQLESDARNKSEALELVEEYLAGNIVTGVDMKCRTKPVCSGAKMAGIALVSLMIAGGLFLGSYIKNPQSMAHMISGVNAVQPPLKTSYGTNEKADFKREWQNRQTKEALDQITR